QGLLQGRRRGPRINGAQEKGSPDSQQRRAVGSHDPVFFESGFHARLRAAAYGASEVSRLRRIDHRSGHAEWRRAGVLWDAGDRKYQDADTPRDLGEPAAMVEGRMLPGAPPDTGRSGDARAGGDRAIVSVLIG